MPYRLLKQAGSTLGDLLVLAAAVGWPATTRSRWQERVARRVYRRLATRYDRHVIAADSAYGAPLDSALRRLKVEMAPRRVLDVASGTGFAALTIAERYGDTIIFACDLSADMLRQAAVQARMAGRTLYLVRAAGGRLPYRDGVFDLVALQNAPPPLREMARVLKPGGALVVCFTSGGLVPAWLLALLRRRVAQWGIGEIAIGRIGRGLYVLGRKRPRE